MRAAVVTEPGPPDAIEIIDIATPEPGAGEIRVRVAAAGVNPVDLQTRAGAFHELGWIDQPAHVGLGWDVAGTVTAVGAGADFAVGDRVAALSEGVDRALGAYAEEVVVPAAAAALVPSDLPLTDAATVPLNALTAWQALDLLGKAAGRTLLVTGAAGGVGGYAVAFAAARGWQVTGLARSTDGPFVTSTGASALITSLDGEYDAVVDAAVLGDAAVAVTREHYVGVIPPAVPDGGGRVRTEAVMVTASSATLAQVLAATAAGTLPARIHATVPLEQAALAHKAVEAGGIRGRYLLIPG